LESVAEFDYTTPPFMKRIKKSGPAYIVMRIMQQFREDHKRNPLPASRDEDIKKVLVIRDQLSDAETVPDDYFEHIFAQVSPVAAIVGGAVAQEVIKAVSQKEAPHFNYFLFDPQACCGFIETVDA